MQTYNPCWEIHMHPCNALIYHDWSFHVIFWGEIFRMHLFWLFSFESHCKNPKNKHLKESRMKDPSFYILISVKKVPWLAPKPTMLLFHLYGTPILSIHTVVFFLKILHTLSETHKDLDGDTFLQICLFTPPQWIWHLTIKIKLKCGLWALIQWI